MIEWIYKYFGFKIYIIFFALFEQLRKGQILI